MNTTSNILVMVSPELGMLHAVSYDEFANSNDAGPVGLRAMIAEGKCTIYTFANGDRLIAGPRGIGAIDTEERGFMALTSGAFGIMKEPVSDTEADAAGGKPVVTEERLAIEVVGPAIVCGPVDPAHPGAVTPLTMTEMDVKRYVAFERNTANAKANLLSSLLRALATADNDNDDDEDENFRADVSDEDLADCGCDGCKDELARRAVEKGGSRALN